MKCPKCRIDGGYLRQDVSIEVTYDVFLDGEMLEYEEVQDTHMETRAAYKCPHCMVMLANEEEEAIQFLKGEIEDADLASYYLELSMEARDLQ